MVALNTELVYVQSYLIRFFWVNSHASAGQGLGTWAMVFDNGASSTLDSEDTGDLENDICVFQVSSCISIGFPITPQGVVEARPSG